MGWFFFGIIKAKLMKNKNNKAIHSTMLHTALMVLVGIILTAAFSLINICCPKIMFVFCVIKIPVCCYYYPLHYAEKSVAKALQVMRFCQRCESLILFRLSLPALTCTFRIMLVC